MSSRREYGCFCVQEDTVKAVARISSCQHKYQSWGNLRHILLIGIVILEAEKVKESLVYQVSYVYSV